MAGAGRAKTVHTLQQRLRGCRAQAPDAKPDRPMLLKLA